MMILQKIKHNLQEISRTIKDLNLTKIQPITIIGITKNHNFNYLQAALQAGIYDIGESKVQEAEKKFQKISKKHPAQMHLIGHLQTNKTKKAVSLFDCIQTVDSYRLAKKINEEAKKIEKIQKIFLQINISNDYKKFGFNKQEVLLESENIQKLENIKTVGLMTITANKQEEKDLRKNYKEMRKLRETIKEEGIKSCDSLSMGMSNDYMYAIQEGATHIRIGTLLFGARKK